VDIAPAERRRERRSNVVQVLAAFAGDARATISLWRSRVRYRRALARMGERDLNDIGVNWSQIADEASKPFWRP
jgi:uncharacterized protein YjiS (DUF1127 family)